MATTKPGVLSANQVATVSVDAGLGGLVVVNRSQTGEIWVTIDGTEPTVAGNDCYCVLGARDFTIPRNRIRQGPIVVKMIASDPLVYTVEAIA